MYILIKQDKFYFSIEDKFLNSFLLSKHFYSLKFLPDYLLGVENIKGELCPVINLFGLIDMPYEIKPISFLVGLNNPLSFLVYSEEKPNLIELMHSITKFEIDSDLKKISNFSYKLKDHLVYDLNIEKIEKLIKIKSNTNNLTGEDI
jgi:chemotaxis signal transduction protein